MMMQIPESIAQNFRGKKITLMGLGLLGRGVGDAEFLAACGAELIVTDLKTAAELAPSIERLKDFPNIVYHLGGHRLEDFEDRDMIVRAPNTPLDTASNATIWPSLASFKMPYFPCRTFSSCWQVSRTR